MKPGAKKGLIVICVLYAVTVGVMVWNFMQRTEPSIQAADLRQRLEQVRRWAAGADRGYVRDQPISEQQAESFLENVLKVEEPGVPLAQVQQRLEETRQWANQQDKPHIRGSEISEKEAESILSRFFARRGSIININYTLLMQCLNFGILLLILYGWLWDPILEFLDQRRRTVRENMQQTEQSKEEARKLQQKRREELEELRSERTEILDQARSTAEQQRSEIVEEARGEARRVREQTEERLQEEVRRARVSLQQEVAELAIELAARVLRREVSREDHDRVIEDMLESMELQAPEEASEQE
ncbi:MAG: F0F1 ATP synthase subunit B [Planctomycetota bacterium]